MPHTGRTQGGLPRHPCPPPVPCSSLRFRTLAFYMSSMLSFNDSHEISWKNRLRSHIVASKAHLLCSRFARPCRPR
jgi:hypothetical protein